ncbi:MAG: hypothetical protein EPN21_12555 [Methylococcaceae bacterium]|nr:MAG: hypothetical protein EPN21_12555 [Methylococcaceae bacterium]
MTSIFQPNQTSAKLMVQFAAQAWLATDAEPNQELQKRYLLVYDMYIKARSYVIINKVAFWLAFLAAIMVLIWPSLAVVSHDLGIQMEFLKSAVIQTTVTGFAALTFAVYAHYKKRQLHAENLMRRLIYSDEPFQALVSQVLAEMERVDSGFTFYNPLINNDKNEAE